MLEQRAQQLLSELIRFKTVNPPGGERPAQEHLARFLAAAGVEAELAGASPERPNLVARLEGSAPGPTLCYLGHIDTVLADPAEWERDPFGGELHEGFIWGRGAIDMKSQVAAEAAAIAELAAEGWRPARGALVLCCVVDEETGGEFGAQWLTRERPELVRCDLLINEGAGEVFWFEGRPHYGVACAEKGVFRFTVTTHGRAAHASLPALGDNALLKIAPILEAFGRRPQVEFLCPQSRTLIERLGGDPAQPAALVERLRAEDPRLAAVLEPLLGITFAPTRIAASEKINVIPSRCELKVDCRVPPGAGEAEVREAVAEVLAGIDGYTLQFTERTPANGSPVEGELWEAIAGWLAKEDPDGQPVPMMLSGFSDSHHFRAAFPDCVAYGFFPQRHQTMLDTQPLMHAPNERIDVRDLAWASRFFKELAVSLLG